MEEILRLEACLPPGVVADLWCHHFGSEAVLEDLSDDELARWQSIVIAEISEAANANIKKEGGE